MTRKRPFLKRVLNYIHWRYKDVLYYISTFLALKKIKSRMKVNASQRAHGQKREVIITLTSHRLRFKTLHLTLECLLRQNIKPDRVVLWLDERDMPYIPNVIQNMTSRGLDIRMSPTNIFSFNKIIPALRAFPEAILVTVDDDIYYQENLLQLLLENWSGSYKEVVCNLAFEITQDEAGNKLPFKSWTYIREPQVSRADIMPFGVGGVLYPPGALSPNVLNEDAFTKLCPRADDVWLYWMGRLNGVVYHRIGGHEKIVEWPFSQKVALKHENNAYRNDLQIANMVEEYGWPPFEVTKAVA